MHLHSYHDNKLSFFLIISLNPSCRLLLEEATLLVALAITSKLDSKILVIAGGGSCSSEEPRHLYLVLMEGDPAAFHLQADGKRVDPNSQLSKAHAKHLTDSHDQLLSTALKTGSYFKVYSFKHLVNGFAVHTTPSQAKKLKSSPGVTLVEKDRGAKIMTTYTPKFLDIPQGVWSQEGGPRHAGEGIVIGFVDTGINPMHPNFAYDSPSSDFSSNISHFSGACEEGPRFPSSFCNGKIVSARYFSAGAQAATSLNSSVDILSPFDAVGHGSHVASTAAGNYGVPVVMNGFFYGRASGMAPRARIAVYKAIYPTIGTLSDVVSAIDQLSVGPDEPPEDTLTFLNVFDIFMLFARRAGVFVVQAAGNQGPNPFSVVSFSPWAVGVAACNTDRSYPGTLLLGDGQKIGGVGLSGPTFGKGFFRYKLVLAKDAVKVNASFPKTADFIEECQHPEALDANVVIGSIVICTFSSGFFNQTSTVTAIIDTAKHLRFTGFVFVANPVYGDFIAQPIPFSVPGILIPKVSDAQMVMQYYEQQTKRSATTIFSGRAAIGEGRVASFTGRAPIVSRFSSRGPDIIDKNRNAADVLKPDVLAPGNQIWGAWSPLSVSDPILNGEHFALLSGTSMAAPHVAGIAALVKQFNPSWTPSMIASAISTSATKYDNLGDPIMAEGYETGSLYRSAPFGYGSGLVNAARALDPGLVFSSGFDDYVNFLCAIPNTDPSTVKVATGGMCSRSLTYPADLNTPSVTITSLKGTQVVRRSVKNVGIKSETFLGSVVPPNGTMVSLNPTWFTVRPDETQSLVINFSVTERMSGYSFGEIVLTGSLDHIVRIPLSVLAVSV